MKTIYKYQLNPGEDNELRTAGMGRILHVEPGFSAEVLDSLKFGITSREERIRGERVTIWCAVDTDVEQVTHFIIVGTGHPIPPNSAYCGTAVMSSGLVWHVFVRSLDVRHLFS